jgi:hypothetical protein
MYLIACRIKIRMKCSFSTFNHKILNLSILTVYRKKFSQSDHMDCKIIIIEWEEKGFFCGEPRLLSMF